MGLRYKVQFADSNKNNYVVEVYREDYTGSVQELTGAPSCFVVSGTDDDFIYAPIRTTSATLTVLESDLLLDLYSINNQYAKVLLKKNGILEWTGYIKPEQFTQPYVASVEAVSVECVSALNTLEHITYKQSSETGYISIWNLLKNLIGNAKGGYRGICIPQVYSDTESMTSNVFESMTIAEECFTTDERNELEVLESVCKVLNWSCYDIGGYVYFVDHDWMGQYRLYDEGLNAYAIIEGTEILLQDVGFNGSGSNTLDIIPGYNKASVKSENKVFDEAIKNEDFKEIKPFSSIEYISDKEFCYKKFVHPKIWEIYSYNNNKQLIDGDVSDPNFSYYGAVAMRLAEFKGKKENGVIVPDVNEYPFEDAIQMRYLSRDREVVISSEDELPIFRMKGANAVWSEGAISINAQIRLELEYRMIGLIDFGRWEDGSYNGEITKLRGVLKIGDWYWDGSEWVKSYKTFIVPFVTDGRVDFNSWVSIKDTKTPDMPYQGLSGYVIQLPDKPITGKLEFTMLSFDWSGWLGQELYVYGCTMKGLSFDYVKKDGNVDEGENGDRVYENIVNEKYMSEAEEITFEIGSYNGDGATYSKLLLNGDWLKDNLYCAVVNEYIRPEELMIRRIVNRYGETKIKLTEALCMTDAITPISILKERTMQNKTFSLTSGEWDYENNRMIVQIQEDIE